MNKKVIFIILLVILAGFLFWGFQTGFLNNIFFKPANQVAIPEGMILFYGEGCPHCKNVDEFIMQNKITDKVKFANLEVWSNKDNQTILGEVALKCGISSGSVGVPLLYDGNSKCYVGDIDAIDFLKTQAGIK
jgi:glutaredoxin